MGTFEDYESAYTGEEIDAAVEKITDLKFMTAPSDTNEVATRADLPSVPDVPAIVETTALLKGDGAGNAVAAVPGSDYQTPLSFYSTPSEHNKVITESEMGTQLQSYMSGTSTTWSGTVNCGQTMLANPATARTTVSITLGAAKATTLTSEWHAGFKAGANCAVTVTPPSGKTLKWANGVPTWTDGHWYELDFVMSGSYIIVAVLDVDMTV